MSKFDQQAHIYRAFCIKKIKTKLHENSCPLQTRTHTPESDITYGPRVDVQHVRQLGHLVGRVWFVFEFTLLTSLLSRLNSKCHATNNDWRRGESSFAVVWAAFQYLQTGSKVFAFSILLSKFKFL